MSIEHDPDEWDRPYKKLAAVEELNEANGLLEHYRQCFEKKYKTRPIFGTGYSHVDDLKTIAKMCQGRAREIIRHYFEIKNDWFHQNAHSIDVLRKNIGLVNASLGKAAQHQAADALEISPWFRCVSCGKSFMKVMKVTELEYPEHCKDCSGGK